MAVAEAVTQNGTVTVNLLTNPQPFLDAVSLGVNQTVFNFVNMLPNLLAAVILVIVGWFVGGLFAKIVNKLFEWVKLEEFLKAHRVEDALGGVKVSKVLTQLVKYYVILIFLQAAVQLISLGALTVFLGSLIAFAPLVIAAAVIMLVAALAGELVKEKVLEVYDKESYMQMLASGSKYLILFFGLMMALDTIGFRTSLLENAFLAVLQSIGIAFALAVGLAFGLGGQDLAKEEMKDWKKKLHF
jgi:uncharacterized membrane protein